MKKLLWIIFALCLASCQQTQPTQESNIIDIDLKIEDPYFNDGYYDIICYDQAPEAWIDLSKLSLEEKVAQLFILDFYSIQNKNETEFNTAIEDFLQTYPVGGFIYFSDNVVNKSQVLTFNDQLQAFSKRNHIWPFFISVDEEGGLVSRLGKKQLVTHLPDATTLAESYSVQHIFEKGRTMGQEMSDIGFNMNFAPVLDTNINPNNPVIARRAFSSDPLIVSDYALAFGKGLYDAQVIPFGKHYPGHGNTIGDSHLNPVTSYMTYDDFQSGEGYPFTKAVNNRLPGIMVGHISAPNLSSLDLPASLNPDLIENYLRKQLFYDELVITDSLQMKAITSQYDSGQAAILAIQAGCDIILMPEDFNEAYDALLTAVEDDIISEDRIDQSLERIYRYKRLLQ